MTDNLPWDNPVKTRAYLMEQMLPEAKAAAMLLWQFLDDNASSHYWSQRFQDCWEASNHGDRREWEHLEKELYFQVVPLGLNTDVYPSWDCDRWEFLVPYVGGGYMMGLISEIKNTIVEEPGD